MKRSGLSGQRWLIAAVLLHLTVSIVHGAAHTEAHVPLSRAASLFVFLVILIGPLAGLALTWPAERVGRWIVAVTMAGALVFGLVNHFVLDSPDHVANIAAPWRPLFAGSAILLAVIELAACAIAIRVVRRKEERLDFWYPHSS